nr:MAG TPA: gelsolin-like protein [Caudoviricetes sp.]
MVLMSGHLFVWCGSRADNLTRGELWHIINT